MHQELEIIRLHDVITPVVSSFCLSLQKKYLTSVADSLSIEIEEDMDFIVLGCDGVWDVNDVSLDELRQAVAGCRKGQSSML